MNIHNIIAISFVLKKLLMQNGVQYWFQSVRDLIIGL